MKTFLALLAALGLILAACGDDDTSDTSTGASDSGGLYGDSGDTADADADSGAGDAGAPVEGDAITIAGFQFEGVDAVAVGTEVTVSNTDGVTHTWTSTDGEFDSGNLSGGDTFSHTFDEAGTFDYLCEIHTSMTGSITVEG